MVGAMSWFHSDRKRSNEENNRGGSVFHLEKPETLGILAFDTAKTMSRLISLYKSLSDDEINRLRKKVMKSRGVLYLNSEDEGFLLTLACAERLEDLDRAANAVAQLGQKCSDGGLHQFDQAYKNLKLGYIDVENLNYGSKDMDKAIGKMEKLIDSTSNLYEELQVLSELEASERRLNDWKKSANSSSAQHANFDHFEKKIRCQRKQVRHLKDISLWNQSFNKSVRLMAYAVGVVYAKICNQFGPYIPILPHIPSKTNPKSQQKPNHHTQTLNLFHDQSQASRSGPIPSSQPSGQKAVLVRFLSRDSSVFVSEDVGFAVGFGIGCRDKNDSAIHSANSSNKVLQAAPPSTVGGSGLALRYANVIVLAEKYLQSDSTIGKQAREDLYNMLPVSLKTYVRSKLRNSWAEMEQQRGSKGGGFALAEGWRDAVDGILEWLGPIAHDTLTWQSERNYEQQRFVVKPTLLLMQTLHYSDLLKTETAIAEVLVGLSCIFWYENRKLADDSED
ncbi:hypothetical protein Nepgr_024911 [Nepenthes gracilis]|uniref:Uncharacterized protein n=1 Tax=Nepenthes gracilis TaxID=150966 RepID=A0AAD3XZ79_NEPGR|nr:hypothetical protein Nepgr_024911 [Nepenthes gracilis]